MDGLRVTIVGGGIGGLTTALCLARFGHRPTVVEQATELRPVGAGISLWPNGIKVLNLLGLGPQIAAIGGRMDRMAYADRSGRVLIDFALAGLYARVGERCRPVARAELQDLLLGEVTRTIGAERLLLGTRVEGVSAAASGDGPVVVTTAGGGRIEGDLVVAADGTHSRLREVVVGHRVERRYVGYVNWNGLVTDAADIAPAGTWLTWVAGGQRASVMPVGGGRCYFFFDVPMPLADVESLPEHRAALGRHFEGWAPAVGRLVERMRPERMARLPIHDLDPLPTWQRGRLVLLGDAAHTMSPDLGQGGCQAMEDAWVLAHYLTATSHSVTDALARYDAERRPHTAELVRRARRRADTTHAVDPAVTEGWYRSLETDGPDGIIDGLAQSVEIGPCR
jgi:FAD-dependent urate hydroxylase